MIEITEHECVSDLPAVLMLAQDLRRRGVRFALDDFGDGRSSLRLWSELRPDYVKVDKYFVRNIDTEAVKVQTLRGLLGFAELFGTKVIAEGIETEAELVALRDLGVDMGQGFYLGRPAARACTGIPDAVTRVVRSRHIAVLPEARRLTGRDFTIGRLAERVPPIEVTCTVERAIQHFTGDEGLRAVALVDGPLVRGLLTRRHLFNLLAKPYFRDVFNRKPVLPFAYADPLVLDHNTGIDGATDVLTSSDQRYLTDGFVVTDGGRYLGLGTGQGLVRAVTEARIEAARHANPLTFLPGNIPISEHIGRLLAAGGIFAACYADLNEFKPFNDHYGYWRGDEMIRLLARTLVAHCDPRRDFIGHVGGDDFVLLFQSGDWQDRCKRAIDDFNLGARALFDEQAMAAGGIEAEDRHGVRRFFAFTTLSIGAVVASPGQFHDA